MNGIASRLQVSRRFGRVRDPRKLPVPAGDWVAPFSGANWPPHGTDWQWQPLLWGEAAHPPAPPRLSNATAIGTGARLFHDCPLEDLSLDQQCQDAAQSGTARTLALKIDQFTGSFLSLAIDLPEEALRGLTRGHLISCVTHIDTAATVDIFARLNIRHGPNTDHFLRQLPQTDAITVVEFDLAYSKLNEKRVSKAWVDLIFERPGPNHIQLHDMRLARLPRAAL